MSSEITPHAEYRRQARRIRSAFAKAPHMRTRALCDLAHRENARRPKVAPPSVAATFAEVVRERMDGPMLRYSHRVGLIREAERRGIRRFEANLIIAAVQHEAGERQAVEVVEKRSSWIAPMIAVIATQSAIVMAVWCLIH